MLHIRESSYIKSYNLRITPVPGPTPGPSYPWSSLVSGSFFLFLIWQAYVYGSGWWLTVSEEVTFSWGQKWPGCVNHANSLFLLSMPNNRPEILPRLEGANMPLGESFSFMQQTNSDWASVGARDARCWAEAEWYAGVEAGRPGLESRGPAWLLWPWALSGSWFSPL